MSNNSALGLAQCFHQFTGAYCYRKSIQCLCSSILLLASLTVFCLLLYKHRIDKQIWISLILLSMILVLMDNIIFCFYNQQYWLFATESYLFSLYYLAIVSYVCRAYVLKKRGSLPAVNPNVRPIKNKLENPETKIIGQVIFYGTVALLGVIYTIIFITSVIYEDEEKSQQSNSPSKVRYCEQVWYLCFDALCFLLSIAVLIIMYKNQREENDKFDRLEEQYQRRPTDSIITNEDLANIEQGNQLEALIGQRIHNPLREVWIWILLNVASQVINLAESGLYLEATPPSCMLIYSKPEASNILQIFFLFCTMYMGFVGTLWYTIQVKMVREKSVIDRTIRYPDQIRHDGNIQLFLSSKQETITI